MHPISLLIREQQKKDLEKIKDNTNTPVNVQIRKAIDTYLKDYRNKKQF